MPEWLPDIKARPLECTEGRRPSFAIAKSRPFAKYVQ